MLKLFSWIMKPAVKKAFKKLENDKEFQEATKNYKESAEKLEKAMDKLGDSEEDRRLRELANKLLK